MNAKQANQISIIHFISECLKINPVKANANYCLYISPLRTESRPSFKVSIEKNLWVDYGLGIGGTLIDLIITLYPNLNISEAINLASHFKGNSFSFQQQKEKLSANPIKFVITKIQSITVDIDLSKYIEGRGIRVGNASQYVKSIQYNYGKWTFKAVGFKNLKGWVLRNNKFKGCTHSSISLITNNSSNLIVFEGFFDFLSYLELYPDDEFTYDYLVLNSLSNTQFLKEIIPNYNLIHLFLDNDKAGCTMTNLIIMEYQNLEVVDRSILYQNFNDLNDYLIHQKLRKE
ncbi:toprim domain-containing protein [Sphingobacterium humi]|uniref:Mobilization protein n=1 Tax=Sphingobacterium humi TaxID=1796905 RepID=A0A6N8L4W6_9SPHI|nr:toprim domain-containing protein [Sphingobacterium humi]MVZ63491.1 mobilization protein [Sphingobacterium humi]